MITLGELVHLHSEIEQLGLCRLGTRDANLLNSAIEGQQWFDTELRQYCHVAYCINAFHIFVDGNKRTAYLVMLGLREYEILFDEGKLSDLILYAAANSSKLTEDTFVSKVQECILTSPSYSIDDFLHDPNVLIKVMEKHLTDYTEWFNTKFPNGASSAEEVLAKLNDE